MRASVRRVTVNNLLVGRKFFTPEMRFSRPPSLKRSVNCRGKASLSYSFIYDAMEGKTNPVAQ